MPTFVSTARGTGNILADQREVDFSEKIDLLDPDSAPLTQFSKKLSKSPTVSPEFSWFEDDLDPRFDRIDDAAGYLAGDTVLTVDNGTYFRVQDLVRVTRTGELVRVTGIAGDDVTVIRGVGSTAAALLDDDELLIIGSAAMEGDTSKAPRTVNPTKVTNYCQIIRTPFEMTETLRHSKTRTTPHDWAYQANKGGIEHRKDLEYVFLLGRPSENTGGTHPRRTTGGALHFANQNGTNAGGTLTETEFFTAFRRPFRYGSKKRLGLASPLAVDVINSFPRGKVEFTQSDNTYGVSVFRYVTPHGVVNMVTHWLLEGDVYGGYIVILDMDEIRYRYLANEEGSRDTRLLTNRQANDADTRKDEYLTEAGLEFGNPLKHGYIYGITG